MDDPDDSSEAIRRQMAESRSRLSEKLKTLEEQVSGTVQSTGTAVSETAVAVKETVDTITDAVQGAVKAVTDTFDLQQHMKHHPWLMIGGAVAVGYLANELSRCSDDGKSAEVGRTSLSVPDVGGQNNAVERRMNGTGRKASTSASAPRSDGESVTSFLGSLTSQVVRATAASLTESLRQAAAQVGPQLTEFFAGHQRRAKETSSNGKEHSAEV